MRSKLTLLVTQIPPWGASLGIFFLKNFAQSGHCDREVRIEEKS
jgi:hypothetical protein